MRKIILYSAMSADGYIARKDSSIDWLDEFTGDYGYVEFLASVDTTIMGNNTYMQMLTFSTFPYPDKKNFVVTSKESTSSEHKSVTFISPDNIDYFKNLKNEPGLDIWLVGGGMTNNLFLRNGLIDEIRLFVIPVILGDGIPLLRGETGIRKLNMVNILKHTDGVIELRYSI